MNGLRQRITWAAFFAVVLFSAASHADTSLDKNQIWAACWGGKTYHRKLNYPYPIKVSIQNQGSRDISICVYDNRCPFTMFKGRLKPKHTIYRSACADKRKRGSFTVMTNTGRMWFYKDTKDKRITLK